jgi:hypothetical protein
MDADLYFVCYRGPCDICGGSAVVNNPAWEGWQHRYRHARGEDLAALLVLADSLEREHGPEELVCTACNGTGQVEREAPLSVAFQKIMEGYEYTTAYEPALTPDDHQRRDLFAAAAITGLLAGESGRRLLCRAHHMGSDGYPVESALTMEVARRVATSAALVAAATLEQLAYHDQLLTAENMDAPDNSSTSWRPSRESDAGPTPTTPGVHASSPGGPRVHSYVLSNTALPHAVDACGAPIDTTRVGNLVETGSAPCGDVAPVSSLRPTRSGDPGPSPAPVASADLPSPGSHTPPPAPQAGLGSPSEDGDGDDYDQPPWGDGDEEGSCAG